MTCSLSEFMSHYQARFEQRFLLAFEDLASHDTSLVEAMRYSALDGGKRIRPLLAYAAAEAIGEINSAVDDLAAAVECIHVYSLIHDDLPAMDNDELRRGKATSHLAFDEATAILAGDALQGLAYELIAQSAHIGDSVKVAAISQLARCAGVRGMVLGQAIDLNVVASTPTLSELETMHLFKTAALIEASVVLGALACQASHAQVQALVRFSRAIGLAFQVQDDILDVTADTAMLGKAQGSDIERNKPTYVSLLGLDDARRKARNLKDEAIDALDDFGDNAHMLGLLATLIVDRSY